MNPQNDPLDQILNLLPPARQQAVRRQLAKIAEERPHQHLELELLLLKLEEMRREAHGGPTASAPAAPLDFASIHSAIDTGKREVVGEIVTLKKEMLKCAQLAEDLRHIRACTDRTEAKLDSVRPYRTKVAAGILVLVLIAGVVGGWYGRISYAQYRYEQSMRAR